MLSKVCSRSQGQPPGRAQAGHDRDQLLKLLAGSLWIHSVWGSDFPQCNISSMPDLLVAKPDASEHAPYFSRYVDLVPDGDILGTLAGQIDGTLAHLRQFPMPIR